MEGSVDRAWKFMERAFSSARARALVIMAIVGLGCCRACLGWILDLGRHNSIANPQLLDFHLLIDIGEVMGFVACALYVRRKGPLIKMGFPILLSLLCFAVSAILIAAIPIGQATSPIRLLAMGTASIGCGFGYACLFVFWLELCGCMQPSRAIFAIGGSYAVSFLAWALLDGMDLPHRCVLTIAFFLASALLLIASTIRTDQEQAPPSAAHKKHDVLASGLGSQSWHSLMALAMDSRIWGSRHWHLK